MDRDIFITELQLAQSVQGKELLSCSSSLAERDQMSIS